MKVKDLKKLLAIVDDECEVLIPLISGLSYTGAQARETSLVQKDRETWVSSRDYKGKQYRVVIIS